MPADEYGDIGKVPGAQWATMDTVLPGKDLHISGSLRKGTKGNIVFWMTPQRPAEVSHTEWEAICQKRWDVAFSHKESTDERSQLDRLQGAG